MPRERKGTIWRSPDGKKLKVRISVKDHLGRPHRPWHDLPPKLTDKQARAAAQEISKAAEGQPWDPDRFKHAFVLSKSPTVEEFVQKVWFPSRVGTNKSLRSDRSRWKNHLSARIGHLKMHEVKRSHLKALVQELDDQADTNEGVNGRAFGEKSAVNCWALVKALFRDARKSKRKEVCVLDGKPDPTDDVLPPNGPKDAQKQWLFPEELQQLLACDAVPLERRRIYAATVYLFCRPGEVLALLWGHSINLKHSMVRINRSWDSDKLRFNEYTKTGDDRNFALESILRPMFQAMQQEAAEGATLVFPTMRGLASYLRADLLTAGVDRAALHEKKKGSRMMRFHDLRATGITYLALRGASDNDVRDRAGHSQFKTTLEYIRRGQQAHGATLGDPFAPLPDQLTGRIELSQDSSGGQKGPMQDQQVSLSKTGDGLPSSVTHTRPHTLSTGISAGLTTPGGCAANGQDDSRTIGPEQQDHLNRLRVRVGEDPAAQSAGAVVDALAAAYDGDDEATESALLIAAERLAEVQK